MSERISEMGGQLGLGAMDVDSGFPDRGAFSNAGLPSHGQLATRNGRTELIVALPPGSLRRRVVQQLKSAGFAVIEAVDACDAADLLGQGPARPLILSSKLGPSAAGRELAETVGGYAHHRQVPVLVLVDDAVDHGQFGSFSPFLHTLPAHRFRSEHVLARAIVNQQARVLFGELPSLGGIEQVGAMAHAQFEGRRQQVMAAGGWLAEFERLLVQIRNAQIAGPVMPELMRQVSALLTDPNTTLREVAAFAGQHPSVATQIISVANSAYFSGRSTVRDLRQAVMRLGLSHCAAVMHSVALRGFVEEQNAQLREIMLKQLRKAHLTSVIALRLAQRAGIKNAGEAHVTGLLHNVGVTFFLFCAARATRRSRPRSRTAGGTARRTLGPAESEALLLLAQRHSQMLNGLVCQHLHLPSSIKMLEDGSRPRVEDDIARVVCQAQWAAERILEDQVSTLLPDEQSARCALDAEDIAWMDSEMPRFRDALASYGVDLTLN